ncbi:malate dehydrogenase, mitochondrial-like [Drosophila innubila]|uniref:malate dehydrogenase, mitochondrial-like n=1 Tax=Drosophila innubila TaxID=198719 RepID=UPI00148C8733|nr:malate dehydrogenase, mitochondrial-like [Drosophila innubila]
MQTCGMGFGIWMRRSQSCLKMCKCKAVIQGTYGNWSGNSVRNYKVTVVGASGGIGQPLSLMLKQNPLVCELSLHDIKLVKGVAMDMSHICTNAQVESFEGEGESSMVEAMHDSNIVVVPAGMPRKPGMDRDQLLSANGSVAMSVARAVSKACPKALVAFITNPINSVLPIAAEVMKSLDCYDPNRMFGCTTLDVVRARTFIAQHLKVDPAEVNLPVIGGHAGITIMPILSQCCPKFSGTPEQIKALIHHIQEAGTDVVKAKAGTGSATLSMAYAAALFVHSLLRGLNGESNVVECAYVASDVTDASFFATPLELGPDGIKNNLGLPDMNCDELESLEKMLPELKKSIDEGVKFAQEAICNPKKECPESK